MEGTQKILDGRVNLYLRGKSTVWQCSTYLEGKNHRSSTREESFTLAKEFAEKWFLDLKHRQIRGERVSDKTFAQAADRFIREYEVLTGGTRNKDHVRGQFSRIRTHLLPFFGKLALSDVTSGAVQDYRVYRMSEDRKYKPPSASTMHKEIVTLRMVLKTAIRQGWLPALPDLSVPYRSSTKVAHRAWFSPDEYKLLYTATRANVKAAEGRPWRFSAEQLHDLILFMANTGVRPDEVRRIQYRDVTITDDDTVADPILEIVVRGKRGVGYCKSMPGAVMPFKRLLARNDPKPSDLLFPHDHKKAFNRLLEENDLKFDREGNRRTMYSLRHSYISFRLLEGADIYQIAKNCRTSVEMIEKHYAVHLKNVIDASAINVRKPRRG